MPGWSPVRVVGEAWASKPLRKLAVGARCTHPVPSMEMTYPAADLKSSWGWLQFEPLGPRA